MRFRLILLASSVVATTAMAADAQKASFPVNAKPDTKMSFFITGFGTSHGGNFEGLARADQHCQREAQSVGQGNKVWHAYLSTDASDGKPGENARDRIGHGPWYNYKGEMIARDVADLHSANNKIGKQTALTQTGRVVNGAGDTPNMHDILTGSKEDGTLAPGLTCKNWTSETNTDKAQLGHFDRMGGGDAPMSWNSAHVSRSCTQADLQATGGDGLIYCFAVSK